MSFAQSQSAGYLGALLAVSIWSLWIVSTRYAVTTSLDPVAINLLRLAVPVVVFSPLWLPRGIFPRGVPVIPFLAVVVGASGPFALLVGFGLQYAPVSHMVALTPSSIPLYVAVIALLIEKRLPDRSQFLGLACILAGIIGFGGWSIFFADGTAWKGDLMFVAAAMLWAVYSFYFPKTGLSPMEGAGYIGVWGLIMIVPFAFFFGAESLATAPWSDIGLQVFVQGFLASVIAIVAYGLAVQNLGAQQGAAFTSLVPVAAMLAAIPLLGEIPNIVGWVAVILMSIGVLLTSGALQISILTRTQSQEK